LTAASAARISGQAVEVLSLRNCTRGTPERS
jgi:hypothetical protein